MGNLFQAAFIIWVVFLGAGVPLLMYLISSAADDIEKSRQAIKRKQSELEENIKGQIDVLEIILQEAKQGNIMKKSKDIEGQIHNLEKDKKKIEFNFSMQLKRYEIINYRDSILFPGVFLLFCVIFAYLATKVSLGLAVFTSYPLALFFLSVAAYRISKCLNIIADAKSKSHRFDKQGISEVFQRTFVNTDDSKKGGDAKSA